MSSVREFLQSVPVFLMPVEICNTANCFSLVCILLVFILVDWSPRCSQQSPASSLWQSAAGMWHAMPGEMM
jgi:hypothetical protein